MMVKVLLFASLREAAGTSELVVEVPEGTVEALLAQLARKLPALHLSQARVAVNRAFADPKTRLCESDEVALIPPVGGG